MSFQPTGARPINLGGASMQVGLGGRFRMPAMPPQMRPQATPAPDAARDTQREARAYGVAEALSQPIEIGSGSWAEALAEGLAGGLRGRAASRMYAAELERNQAQTQREQQSQGLEDQYRQAQIEALQAETAQAGIPEWAPIPQDQLPQGARFGQENRRTGQRDLDWAPQSGSGNGTSYRVMSPAEVQAMGLPPGSYQMNAGTGQVTPIGRTRGQYTEFAGQSAQFANRMNSAHETLINLENVVNPTEVFAAQYNGGNQDVRMARQAQREFINAILRRESGAVISPEEFDSARMQYFPVPGDGPEVIAQKREARMRAIQGLINASQGAYDEWYTEPEAPEPPATRQSGINRPRGNIRGASGQPRRIRLD